MLSGFVAMQQQPRWTNVPPLSLSTIVLYFLERFIFVVCDCVLFKTKSANVMWKAISLIVFEDPKHSFILLYFCLIHGAVPESHFKLPCPVFSTSPQVLRINSDQAFYLLTVGGWARLRNPSPGASHTQYSASVCSWLYCCMSLEHAECSKIHFWRIACSSPF